MEETTTTPSNSINNHDNNTTSKEYITLRDIAPEWFETLSKILNANGNDDDIVIRLYSQINDYKKCVVGEAYGYDQSYVIQVTNITFQECTTISGNFSYAIRLHNSVKLKETIDKFTKHWNEKHRDFKLVIAKPSKIFGPEDIVSNFKFYICTGNSRR
jgi:hypothetical protein